MNKLFKYKRHGDIEAVRAAISKNAAIMAQVRKNISNKSKLRSDIFGFSIGTFLVTLLRYEFLDVLAFIINIRDIVS